MPIVTEFAPAKINLTLRVLGRRADGYHVLQSLVGFADVGDRLTLDTDRVAGLTTLGPTALAIAGPNLVAMAMDRLAAVAPQLRLGHVTLDKQLPIAAGIGGGSSDAAALLRAVRRANPDTAGVIDWYGIAALLGADVPVCLLAKPAWIGGIGEQITPVELPALAGVLATPDGPVPGNKTRLVFAAMAAPVFTPDRTHEQPRAPPPGTTLAPVSKRDSLVAVMRAGGNDLEAAALSVVPAAGEAKAAVSQLEGCELAQLSGAGPTAFGVFGNLTLATTAAAGLARARPAWWVRAVTISG